MDLSHFEPYQIWLAGVGVLLLVVIAILHFRLLLNWDKRRIVRYLESRGGHVHSIQWQLLGTGWLVHEKTRAYLVEYDDEYGGRRRATCRTALLAGVFLTEE